jgi:hypothetical protein
MSSSSTLRFQADRPGTIVAYIGGPVVGVIRVPPGGFIAQKLTTVPQTEFRPDGTQVICFKCFLYS